VHAAAITGESMDENSARITVMDKDRRMLHNSNYTFIFSLKAIRFRVAEPAKSLNFLICTRVVLLLSSAIFSATLV
jgi:hypothetical protein